MRTHLLWTVALAAGCVFGPNNGSTVQAHEPFEVNGFASDPSTPVEVQLRNKSTDEWIVVSTAVSSSSPFNGESLYNFATWVDMSTLADVRCYYNSECGPIRGLDRVELRVRTPDAQVLYLATFDVDWVQCFGNNFTGSYVSAGLACRDPDSPVMSLRADECDTSADCPTGLRCAQQDASRWETVGTDPLALLGGVLTTKTCVAPCDPFAPTACGAGTQCDRLPVYEGGSTVHDFVCATNATGQIEVGQVCGNADHACPDGPCEYWVDQTECDPLVKCCTTWCHPGVAGECPDDQVCAPYAGTGVGRCRHPDQ